MREIWNNLPSFLDPVAFSVGSFDIRWYSLSYLLAFFTIYALLRWRISYDKQLTQNLREKLKKNLFEDLFIYALIGMFLGAKVGYALFYDLPNFIASPIETLLPFQNGSFVGFFGLSYHGGLLGIVLAGIIFCKKRKLSFIKLSDFIVPAIPLGYFWGRIGNFFNGELFGRQTESSIGMMFNNTLCHPSTLYEAFGEGLLLFLILWPLRNKKALQGKFLGLYLLLYGLVRFFIEFFRQPDEHLGTIILELTMGQLLCFGMIVIGATIITSKKDK